MEDKLDFKKKDKALYMPGPNPVLVEVPPMQYLMVDGKGDTPTGKATAWPSRSCMPCPTGSR